jgi:hypothetical protein
MYLRRFDKDRGEMIKRLLLAISALPLLASCGVVTERGVYEGIRANQKAQSPVGAEGATMKQLPDYDQYKKQREGITNR